MMQWANIVGQLSHKYIWKRIRPGLTELQISNYFTSSIKYLANGTNPYGNICATDKSSASLHYMDGRQVLGDGDLILIDCGARVNKYNSDITRTIPVNGKFTKKQADIYNIVLAAQEAVYKKVDIGVSWQDCHIEAEKTIIRGLQALGMISETIGKPPKSLTPDGEKDFEKIWESRVAYYFFPHGLGHYIGLYTHDSPGDPEKENVWVDYKNMSLRVHRKLEENMIFSNEPGIYFNKYLIKTCKEDEVCNELVNWEVVEDYMKEVRGVRIEDNFVVRKNGSPEGNYINLTAGLPKKVKDIEKFMSTDEVFMDEFLNCF